MKQFDLEEYLKNPNQRVVTRDGRNVRIVCTNKWGYKPIIALVRDAEDEGEVCIHFRRDGKFHEEEESSLDLFFAEVKHEDWVNLNRDGDYYFTDCIVYRSEQEAKEAIDDDRKDYVATIKIEWEE